MLLFGNIYLSKAQSITIIQDIKSYTNNYNVSCKNASDGEIKIGIVGGIAPYTYSWSNGATTKDLMGIAAGSYTLTVTDSAATQVSKGFALSEPALLQVSLKTSMRAGGYNVSKNGGNDGGIGTTVSGGAPPYTYHWSNDTTKPELSNLPAGYYSVQVSDQNGCTANSSITLTEPSPLHFTTINAATHNGYNISCHGGADGQVTIAAAGGTPPYLYGWIMGEVYLGASIENLGAGKYYFAVQDANEVVVIDSIELSEPPNKFYPKLQTSDYNGYEISCNNCFNGSITANIVGGVGPYSYNWYKKEDSLGIATPTINNLGRNYYTVYVTDANGCKASGSVLLNEPSNPGWDLHGNQADSSMAIGTINNEGLNFKTNDSVRMRIGANGEVEVKSHLILGGTTSLEPGILDPCAYILGVGNLGQVGLVDAVAVEATFDNGIQTTTCPPQVYPFTWNTIGNVVPNNNRFLGTLNNFDLNIRTNNIQRMVLKNNGKVGIGTNNPKAMFQVADGFNKLCIGNANGQALDYGTSYIGFNAARTATNSWQTDGDGQHNGASVIYSNYMGDILFSTLKTTNGNERTGITDATVKSNIKMIINADGEVGIGTDLISNTDHYKLAVNGNIRAKKIVVETNWMDKVFDKEYVLPRLREVEDYIKANGHLPNIPSGKEIESNGGDLGELVKLQMQKIEELTLYVIELNKKIEKLENEENGK